MHKRRNGESEERIYFFFFATLAFTIERSCRECEHEMNLTCYHMLNAPSGCCERKYFDFKNWRMMIVAFHSTPSEAGKKAQETSESAGRCYNAFIGSSCFDISFSLDFANSKECIKFKIPFDYFIIFFFIRLFKNPFIPSAGTTTNKFSIMSHGIAKSVQSSQTIST